jgi:HAD superfamily 5'-nucleotidase-like hydrolase
MKGIKAIGFDMDYTLAQYKPETFEALAYEKTVEKLIEKFGYPKEALQSLTFNWEYMAKGLIIDKHRGNTLKVDRHRYVKLAYHGFSPLPNDERKVRSSPSPSPSPSLSSPLQSIYNSTDHSFDEPDFAMVDTLFSLAEGYLFMQLVDLKDKGRLGQISSKPYHELYRDLRNSVDMCHRDGSLKKAVAADPPKVR